MRERARSTRLIKIADVDDQQVINSSDYRFAMTSPFVTRLRAESDALDPSTCWDASLNDTSCYEALGSCGVAGDTLRTESATPVASRPASRTPSSLMVPSTPGIESLPRKGFMI